jgi:predicted methyltransferase
VKPNQPGLRCPQRPPTSALAFGVLWAVAFCGGSAWPASPTEGPADAPGYEFRSPPHPDGIGKVYLGREIAQVMGHPGRAWLERPERIEEERPDLLIPMLGLKPGDVVADVGAGTGYHSRLLARAVAPGGTVYAVDVQPEMLETLDAILTGAGITNVHPVLGTVTDPRLPERSLDLILMVDVYHEFSHPYEMIQGVCRALKPGGQLVVVEFRAHDPHVPIKPLHTMTESQVRREMAVHPLGWTRTVDTLPWQTVICFRLTHPGSRDLEPDSSLRSRPH